MTLGLADTDLDVDDVDAELSGDEANLFFKVLSLKTVVAFFTFFGLTGMLGQSLNWELATTLLCAIGAGVAAVFLGALAGEAAVVFCFTATDISFLWYNVVGCLGTIASAFLISLLGGRNGGANSRKATSLLSTP
jgi:hypothetical protein